MPQTNGVVERFNHTLKYEHLLLLLDTANGQDLVKEVEPYETYPTG
jgi:transposase InsO family protein